MVDLYKKSDRDREQASQNSNADYRSEFRRDYARLLHCPSFRRLTRKRQLLPNDESDFFRNRLTHSMEVAQIAKTIALKLNASVPYFQTKTLDGTCSNFLDVDLVEFAGLAHDLGHPPFGHTGESELDRLMCGYGGFEGNAQTLRILARLEKKVPVKYDESFLIDQDPRLGLNLTYRSLASVLKYDNRIKRQRMPTDKLAKGYYASEAKLVSRIKAATTVGRIAGKFKSIECAIMDIADDIAYSTYDLEDAFKAGLLTPLTLFSTIDRMDRPRQEQFFAVVVASVRETYKEAGEEEIRAKTISVLKSFMHKLIGQDDNSDADWRSPTDNNLAALAIFSEKLAGDGHARIGMTSRLINDAIESVEITVDEQNPSLSAVKLSYEALIRIETLKLVAWSGLIDTRKLKMIERRERTMVRRIFETLSSDNGGYELLPEDHQQLFRLAKDDKASQMRIICDFIAGMTDRYAEGFYIRLRRNTDSIFLPF